MSLGITGTQNGMTEAQRQKVSELIGDQQWTTFHHGDCIGVDKEAALIALDEDYHVVCHPPTNSSKRAFTFAHLEHEPKPYLERNHDIVDESDYLIVVPKYNIEELRSGTWATYRYALSKGTPGVIVFPDGSTREF